MSSYERFKCLDCKHLDYMGSIGDEHGRYFCTAYPSGIPEEILDGSDQHNQVRPDQVGNNVWTLDL